MGTLFAGIIRAPMTSVFMIFEITQDYQIIVPLMVANLLSFAISRRYLPVPIYDALLRQDGVHFRSLPSSDTNGWCARDVMSGSPPFVPPDRSIDAAWEFLRGVEPPAVLVGTPAGLLGTVTRDELAAAREANRGFESVGAVLDANLVHVHPDHPLDVVVQRFSESGGLLPVVSRRDARRVEGAITVADLTAFAAKGRKY
jgi:CIC family chloride channel protein